MNPDPGDQGRGPSRELRGDPELLEAYLAYQRDYFTRRDYEATVAAFDEEICGFGSSEREVALDRKEAEPLYAADIGQVPRPVGIGKGFTLAKRLTADAGIVMERIDLEIEAEGERLSLPGIRGTYTFVRRGAR